MTDLAALMATAGVSRPWLARMTGRHLATVDNWCRAGAVLPEDVRPVVAWLHERIAAPPPVLAPYRGTARRR